MRYGETMLFLFLVIFVLADFYFLFRNNDVYRERERVLDAISTWAEVDISQGREWRWRYDEFESVSYWSMLFSVRPVGSFFDGAACTKG